MQHCGKNIILWQKCHSIVKILHCGKNATITMYADNMLTES